MATFVSHKFKLIFCHIPRTGGTSFTAAIKPHLGRHDSLTALEQHTPLSKIKRVEDNFDDYLKVAIMRDEAKRRSSCRRGGSNDAHSEYWLSGLADVLISFENLPGSAERFLRSIGIECKFPHLNKRD